MDKNQAVIDYFLTCDQIKDSPLYFNFVNAKDGTKHFLTLSQDKNIHEPYIDGSMLKRYSVTVQDFRSVSINPLVKMPQLVNENIADFADVQALIDWIAEQNKAKVFPDFGEDCIVENIQTTTDNPRLDQIDVTVSPPLARYSFTVQVNYVDYSDKLWN